MPPPPNVRFRDRVCQVKPKIRRFNWLNKSHTPQQTAKLHRNLLQNTPKPREARASLKSESSLFVCSGGPLKDRIARFWRPNMEVSEKRGP